MNEPSAAAAPETGIPKFDDLLADPVIAALLDFEPAVRKTNRSDGCSAGLQRELIARIAHCGSPGIGADQMDKNPTDEASVPGRGRDSLRAAWDSAVARAEARERARRESGAARPSAVPGMPNRVTGTHARSNPAPYTQPLLPGQVYNEQSVPENQTSLDRRGEDARDSIGNKLLACRRAYLCEISHSLDEMVSS